MTTLKEFALLEALSPPPSYRTVAALGTTYSVDLVAAAAALGAIDGQEPDVASLGRVGVVRAIHRVGGKVRIAHHPGKVCAVEVGRSSTLPLLDRVVIPAVDLPGGKEAIFHPKVWLVRQRSETEDRFRHVLAVASRNLTVTNSWELSLCLISDGSGVKARTRELPGVSTFVTDVCRAMREEEFAQNFPELDQLRWQLPECVEALRFEHRTGASGRETLWDDLHEEASQVMLISPFLSPETVAATAARWPRAQQRLLVSGPSALNQVAAHTEGNRGLKSFTICALAAESGEPGATPTPVKDEEHPEGADEERGLHAKLIATVGRDQTRLLLGSSNLTTAAWRRPNFEANLSVEIDGTQTFESLQRWVGTYAMPFTPDPRPRLDESDPQNRLESLQHEIAAHHYVLDEGDPAGATLRVAGRGSPSWWAHVAWRENGAELGVARLSAPSAARVWPARAEALTLPRCESYERTRFVIFRLAAAEVSVQWIHSVDLSPALEDVRDRQLVTRLLGPAGFLQFLQSLTVESVEPWEGEPESTVRNGSPRRRPAAGSGYGSEFTIENLLRLVAREPNRARELESVMESHRAAFAELHIEGSEVLHQVRDALRVIAEGMKVA